ncbi:MAG: DUF3237 family protein, partial [Roseococcus sp.]
MSPEIAFVTEIRAEVAPILSLGAGVNGERRIVPITGGRCAGPRLNGEVLPGGADFQHIRPDGVLELEARYALRLDDGALVNVVNRGLRNDKAGGRGGVGGGGTVRPERTSFLTKTQSE